MAAWNELLDTFMGLPTDFHRSQWLQQEQVEALSAISRLRENRPVLSYASAFQQRPEAPPQALQIAGEDLNGLMTTIHGMKWDKGLTLLLHTPGGSITATQSLVEYLRSKFAYIEVIVPAFAMSGGTMISLASDHIVMGRQSQLGPIDPQLGGFSAQAVVDQFEAARLAIVGGATVDGVEVEGDLRAAHLWAPLLQSMGPALLQEARNALAFGEQMVAEWLEQYGLKTGGRTSAEIAHYFSDAGTHKNHGRRIGRDEVRAQGLDVEDLEPTQDLQEAVLTAYHLQTIAFEHADVCKALVADHGNRWFKNHLRPQPQQ